MGSTKGNEKSYLIRWQIALFFFVVSGLFGCGKPFNVKPKTKVENALPAIHTATATSGSFSISADALMDEDYLYDTFDGNLILAGILPVQVKVTNSGSEIMELKDAKFELRAGNTRNYKLMDAEKAYKRLRKYYGIKIYNKQGNKESTEDFKSYQLEMKKPLGASETREGLLFFSVPHEVIQQGSFYLVVRKLNPSHSNSPLELQLK